MLALLSLFSALLNAAPAEKIRVGVLSLRGADVALKAWTPLAAYLTQKMPEVEFALVPLDYAALKPAVERREVDFILTAAGQYVELELGYGITRIATVKNTGPNGGFAEYGGVVVVRANQSAIQTVADLKGKNVLIPDETSFGGWQMQWREFKAIGLDPGADFKLIKAGNNEKTFLDLLAGKGDAATARSDVLERMVRDGKVRQEDFRLLRFANAATDYPYWVSTPIYPEWPFSKLRHTSDVLAERVLVALLELPRDSAAAKAGEIVGFTVPKDYQSVNALYRDLALGPYAHRRMSWHDFVEQYGSFVMSAVLLIALVVGGLALRLAQGNRHLRRENRERQLAETSLSEEKRRSESFLEMMGNIFIVLDHAGRIVLANRRANEVLGYADGELEGRDWFETAVPSEQQSLARDALQRIQVGETDMVSEFENEILTRDGRRRLVAWSNRVMRDGSGKAVAVISAR